MRFAHMHKQSMTARERIPTQWARSLSTLPLVHAQAYTRWTTTRVGQERSGLTGRGQQQQNIRVNYEPNVLGLNIFIIIHKITRNVKQRAKYKKELNINRLNINGRQFHPYSHMDFIVQMVKTTMRRFFLASRCIPHIVRPSAIFQ